MTDRFVFALFLLLMGTVSYPQPQEPFFEARTHQSDYHGPGRSEPEPENLTEVRIGYFGPTETSHPAGGSLWPAVQLAVEKANLEGGYRGVPFRLVPIWSKNPWGSGISRLARAIYEQDLWAIVGSIDGPSTHLAEQLVVKARLTLINPVSTDKTVNLANVPWMFSCLPGEHLQAPVLAKGIADCAINANLTLISSTDHDSRVLAKELKDQLARNRVRLSRHFEIDDQYRNYSDLVGRVMSGQPEVVIVVAGPLESAYLISYLRSDGFDGRIYGGPSIGRTEFLRKAGPAAQGVTFPLLVEVLEKGSFAESYQTKYGAPPDFRALQTYDAVSLLIRAIRKAGLNRVLIRDAVRELSPWTGVSGPIIWDALGQNNRPVRLATVTGSQIETLQLR